VLKVGWSSAASTMACARSFSTEIWAVQGAQQVLLPHALQLARISKRADLVEVACRPVIGVEKCRDLMP